MKIKNVLVLAIFAIAIIGIMAPLNAVKIDNNVKIESKSKTASYRIDWDSNGGKIGTKKILLTTMKKATKIGKLPTPKRTGYIFQGWYTKKTGGTKITKNTVVKKKVRYYGHWKKMSADETAKSKLTGSWTYTSYNTYPKISYSYYWYEFKNDGTFSYRYLGGNNKTGNYKVSSGKITFTNIVVSSQYVVNTYYPDTATVAYKFEKDSNGNEILKIPRLEYSDKTELLTVNLQCSFKKSN